MSNQPIRMYYYGPWDSPGHHLFNEHGRRAYQNLGDFPWHESGCDVDGVLQPGCHQDARGRWQHGVQNQGEALLHHKGGWTALSFWDRSVDPRGACNSNYFARGRFTFEQMVGMAMIRFKDRWNRMTFEVRPAAEGEI